MPDMAAIADILARGGQAEREQLEAEIILCENRLCWLRLLRDTLVNGSTFPLARVLPSTAVPASTGVVCRASTVVLEKVLQVIKEEWVTVRELLDDLEEQEPTASKGLLSSKLEYSRVRTVLESNGHLFERKQSGIVKQGGKQQVLYRRRTNATPDQATAVPNTGPTLPKGCANGSTLPQ